MAYDFYYTMLFTDQGMGNLITITEQGKTAVLFSALIDFGTAQSSLTGDTLKFMAGYIDANRLLKKGPDFDLVVVSHQDNDHWSLFPALLDHYKNAPLTIGRFAYGGNYATFTDSAKLIIGRLAKQAQQNVLLPVTVCSAYSKFDHASVLAPLAVFPAQNPVFQFMPAIANAVTASTRPDIKNNTVSLMVSVQAKTAQNTADPLVLLPGDLTSCTIFNLQLIGNGIFGYKLHDVLSVPHHGSHRTLSDNYETDKSARKFSFAEWFAKIVSPTLLGASAGFTSHRHPYDSVIQLFTHALAKVGKHPYVSYFPDEGKYKATPVEQAIYTNYNAVPAGVVTSMSKLTPAQKLQSIVGISKRIVFKIDGANLTILTLPANSAPNPGLAR